MQKLEINTGAAGYPVWVGSGLKSDVGKLLRNLAGFSARRLLVFSNDHVFDLYGPEVIRSLESAGFETRHWSIPDGEQFKNFEFLEKSLERFSEAGLTRNDAVVALGGGVIGDLAGFSSSIFMRGIPFVQIPTTLLSMIDSSVGGKTGINTRSGKNLAGTFHQPAAVIADLRALSTLAPRELRAGFYELVKHGALGGMELLEQTQKFIGRYSSAKFAEYIEDFRFEAELENLICAQILQKASVVSNDVNEDPNRRDSASRKILNFGHTVGHALELVTGYSYFRHGEAVGYGMLAANKIAKRLEICDETSINLLNDVVRNVGGLPDTDNIDIESLIRALYSDKKSDGKSVQWILLEKIGSPIIVNGERIPDSVVRKSLSEVLSAQPAPAVTKE